MSTENITNKLDNNKDKKISEEELKNNIAKFDANDWIVLTNELEKKNAELVKLLESPVSKVIKEKKLYNKYNKSVDELKILKLWFLCYNRWSQVRLGTGIDTYCLQYWNNWETYKKNELPKMGILRTWKVDEEWLRMERIDNIKQASDVAVRAWTQVEPVVKPAPVKKPIPVANPTPADAVRESIYVQESGIPEIDVREWNIKYSMDQIIKWAESKYLSECENRRLAARDKYIKEKSVLWNINLESYINYEIYLFAFEKYCEVVNKKHDEIIEESWYKDDDEFENQMNLLNDFQKAIWDKYNNIWNEMKKFEEYSKDMQKNKDKYFKWKSEEDIQLAEEKYKEFQSFQQNKYKENWITDDIIASINKTPQSSEETKRYYENLNKILKYQAQLNQEKWKNWDMIDKYDWYLKWVMKVNDKYNDLNFDILKEYSHDMAYWTGYGIDFNKYSTYTSLIQKEWLSKHFQNISKINKVLMNPISEEFPISQIRNDAIEKQLKAERIDAAREKIKTYAPRIYLLCTAITWFWNWLVDATIWVWTSLWAMLLGWRWKDEYDYQLKRKEKWDNFLKISQSSSQTQAVYDSETWAFNFHLDNTISTVSGSVAQMICLISWGGAVWKWIAKLWTKTWVAIWEKAIAKAWLFWMSFITQAWSSYEEAIKWWLGWAWAFAYSMFSASIQSWLELISPNEVLLWKWMWLWKELVQNICGKGNKEWIKLIWKYFLKTVWREIAEENLQEWLQLAAWNLINDAVNGIRNTGLESDWNPNNFLSTAIITTLTTGITTWSSAATQGVHMFNSDQKQLIWRVSSDQELYEDVMNILDNSINGNFKIPNVDKTLLQELRTTLNNIHSNQNNSSNQNDQQQPHEQLQAHERNDNNNQGPMRSSNETIELDPQKKDLIESIWSKFHEERRKSLKKSDWTYESRIEQVTDQEWIQQHNWQTEIDLANTNFEDLPQEWKHENLEAAKVVVELVYDKVANWEEITPEMIEEMARVVHDKRLERNWTEWSFENQRVSYDQLDEEEKVKDRNQVKRAIEVIKQNESSRYFDWQSHKFEVTENQAKNNSKYMDNILNNIEENNQSAELNELRERIKWQYKHATWQEIELNDEQLFSILDAHEQDWILWELTLWQLKKKVKILSDTIKDKNVRRFLLEAGFCGKLFEKVKSNLTKNLDYSESWKYMEKKVDRIIPQSYFTDLDFVFRAWRTEFLIEQTWNENYRVINLTDYQTYELWSWSESVIWREWDITIQSDDYASRQHLTLKIDADWNIIIRDTSTNGTLYLFTDKLSWTQYVQESKNLAQEIRTEDINQEVVETEIWIRNITNNDLSILDSLNKWNKEEIYLNEYWLPKNVISLWNWNKLYVTNCLAYWGRNHIVWYVNEWWKMKLRLFYRSNSEWARRACPWKVTGRNARWEIATGYSKWEEIENSSYETTTRVTPEIQNIFDELPQETSRSNPITLEGMDPKLQKKIWDTILEKEMANNVKITKLFEGYPNDTVEVVMNNNSQDIKRMYENLWQEFDLSGMKIVEWEWYTYLHPFLWNIDVTVCSVNINWSELYFSFSRATNDPQNRVRIEEVRYADAELTSFWIYNKQINAAPLTWKPIDYDNQVPIDMRNNEKIGWTYIDIRTLYQRNPFILKFKDISGTKNIPEQSNYDNPSNEEIVVNWNDQYIENWYKIWDEVNIPRTDGRITKAIITAYNPQTWEYRVEWIENWNQCHKDIQKWQLDSVNKSNGEIQANWNDQYIENWYQIWEEVNIPRTDGRVTKATITAYNPQTWEYRVEWIENGKQWHKDLQKEDLDSVNNEEIVVNWNEIQVHGDWERQDRWVNTERKEMSEVHRSSDVVAIWDLHWNHAALIWNLEHAGLIENQENLNSQDDQIKRTWGDSKVVFQGDIMWDRHQWSMEIIHEIHNLREQAQVEWWDIDIIMWNHDDFLVSYLIWDANVNDRRGMETAVANLLHRGQGNWVYEILQRYWKIEEGKSVYDMLTSQRDQILLKMRGDEYWRVVLEELCNMKILKQVDDVLYCHTNPTPKMIEYLLKWKWVLNGNKNLQDNINTLNRKYQSYLKFKLLWGKENQNYEIDKQDYDNISEIFLNTDNRDVTWLEKYSKQLRERGINMISHGHSGWEGKYNWIKYHDVTIDWGLRIVDSDFSYWKDWTTDGVHSVSVVKQEWWQVVIWDDVVLTENQENDGVFQYNEVEQKIQSWEIYLTEQQNENVKNTKVELDKLWIPIISDDIDFIKNKKLTAYQLKNIKHIKLELDKLWIPMTAKYAILFSDIKLTKKELNNIKNLKYELDKLWINVNADIIFHRYMVLTPQQIENLKTTMEGIAGQNINIEIIDIDYLKDNPLRYEQIVAINEIRNRTWIDIPPRLINDIMSQSLTSTQIENLKTIKSELDWMWIEVNGWNIWDLKDVVLTDEEINNLKKLKTELNWIWIEIYAWAVPTLKNVVLTPTQIENIRTIKEELWLQVSCGQIETIKDIELTDEQIDNLNNLWTKITTVEELQIALEIGSINYWDLREDINKKNEYLEKNRTLSDEDFNQLFKEWNDKWKYWIQNIHQTNLWYCYAYSWFELLKKSNYFDVLIKTSMKKTADGWEVNLPLWDLNWHTIKISQSEIDSKYSFIDQETWKQKNNVNINSNSALWFKILEIGFIKEYIINNDKYKDNPIAQKAREEYQNTWDITITWELLNMIEWWWTSDFFKHILWNEYVSNIKLSGDNRKEILKFVNQWNVKIMLDNVVDDNWPEDTHCTTKDWGVMKICTNHAYSVERTYYDKKLKKDIVVFVNPRSTDVKYETTIDECCKAFNTFDVTVIKINKLFQ